MNVYQKEIILLPYPFSDLENSKIRPALVISNDDYNKNSIDILAVPLTSVIKNETYSIIINPKDLSSGNLIKQSRIKTDKIFAVEKSIVMKKIGKLNDATFKQVIDDIRKII